jgi:release factor glutamine methyltransferase
LLRKIIIKIIGKPMQFWASWYFKKPRNYNYKQIKGIVLPGVFYPHFTISTKLLMQFIEPLELKGKSFLELGCGTGLISVLASQKGALVTSSDVNPSAIENVRLNALNNKVELTAIESDLFKNLEGKKFDYIIINPPYYPKKAENRAEEAWFCGPNFEYFQKLFDKLEDHLNENSNVFMILSVDCELERIQKIALDNQLSFNLELETKKWGEANYIFSISKV